MDVNNDGTLEAKGIQVQDAIGVKNMMVEDDIKSASLALNNQNFTTNNNNISAGIDGITTTTNDRIDFSKNIQLNAGKTITADTANFTSINLDGNNLATQLTKISTKIDHFTINPTNINITNKDFLVNELPTGATTGTTNIQLKTNGDVISKKLQSDNIINTNNLTTKSINVETISQKQTDGTYKSFDLNNLTTTTNNTTTTNADNLINDTNNSAPLFVDTKSVHMNRNLSLNHNTIENLKGLEFTTTQSPSISYTLNDETMQINKNSLPSTIILSSASDTKIKAKEIEGVDGKFTNLYLNGSIFNPSTSSGTISGITSDSINGLTFSTKSKFEKKLTTLSDYNLSNKITNDATNGTPKMRFKDDSGKDINNASSIEMVSGTCYIDFVHLPGGETTFNGEIKMKNGVLLSNKLQQLETQNNYLKDQIDILRTQLDIVLSGEYNFPQIRINDFILRGSNFGDDGITNPDYKSIRLEGPVENGTRPYIANWNKYRDCLVQGEFACRTLTQFGGNNNPSNANNNGIDLTTPGYQLINKLTDSPLFNNSGIF
eukprot:jgi/Bigna1/144143/aug1.84_g18851